MAVLVTALDRTESLLRPLLSEAQEHSRELDELVGVYESSVSELPIVFTISSYIFSVSSFCF